MVALVVAVVEEVVVKVAGIFMHVSLRRVIGESVWW